MNRIIQKNVYRKEMLNMPNVQPLKRKLIPSGAWESSIAFLSGLIFSGADIGGIPSPLPVAIAGCLSSVGSASVLIGSLISYLVTGKLFDCLPLLFALVLITCVRLFLRERASASMVSIFTALCVLISGIIVSVVQSRTGQDILIYAMTAFLTGTASWFMHTVLSGIHKNRKIQLKSSTGCAASVVYILLISALTSFDFPFMNIGRVAGTAITLLGAHKFRYTGGVICGALTTCGVMLCEPSLGMPLLFLPITGLLAGYMMSNNCIITTIMFFLINAMAQLTLSLQSITFSSVSDLLLGCIAYLLLNNLCFDKWLVTGQADYNETIRTISTRLRFMADSIGSVREDTKEIASLLQKKPSDYVSNTVCEKVCVSCVNNSNCWSVRHQQTEDGFKKMQNQRGSGVPSLPEELWGCQKAEQLQAEFYVERKQEHMRTILSSKMKDSRNLLFEQLQVTEEIIASVGNRMTVRYSAELTDSICRFLDRYGYTCDYVIAYYNQKERLIVELYCKDRNLDGCMPAICHILSEAFNIALQELEPVQIRGAVRYRICQATRYKLEQVTVSISADSVNNISGDTSISFQDGAGNIYVVISDGMGTGKNAAVESKMTTEMFRKLICSGISYNSAIRLMNGLMITKSEKESFATLDAAKIDLDCGEMTLIKAGASSTLILQGDSVLRIAAPTFPVGALIESEIYTKTIMLKENDILLMLSDGIHETEYQFIKQVLLSSMDLKYITNEICSKADIFAGGKNRDDITITAVKLVRVR